MTKENHGDRNAQQGQNGHDNSRPFGHLHGVVIAGTSAFIALLLVSLFWPNLTERTKFFTSNFWNLVIAFTVIAQVKINRQQWQSMVDGLDRTDKMIENMQGQLTSMVHQETAMEGQLTAMREQTKIMDDSLKISQRAYVGVHSIETEWEAKRIAITIENTGRTPAEDVKAIVELRAMIPKQWLQPNEQELSIRKVENDFGHTKLFPGNLKIRIYAYLDGVPFKYYPLFVQGHGVIILRCWITYGDGFGNTQTTESAFSYLKDEHTKDGQWYTFPVRSADEWLKSTSITTHAPTVTITKDDRVGEGNPN